ncbi:ArnT family glycosyltransferase [Paenibacillus ferrarius]|uniref:ArnT family glycosyltransferase n=1 Tax=Paenibacillus ferrarius TaxID=1469647 RepID=UPI003D28676E
MIVRKLENIIVWAGLLFFACVFLFSLVARTGLAGHRDMTLGLAGFPDLRIGLESHPAVTLGLLITVLAAYTGVGLWLHKRPASRGSFLLVLLAVAVSLRLVAVFYLDTQPGSDFRVLYENAQKAAAGDFSFGHSEYYVRWVYQLGYTLYQGLILSWFGPGLLPLKLFNVLFDTLSVLLVFRIAANVFGETSGRMAGLLYATYVPNLLMSAVLSNQHLSTLFFAAGCWAAIALRHRKSPWGMAAVGVLFAAGTTFRPMGAFYAGILLLFLLAVAWQREGKLRYRLSELAKKAAVFAAVYLIVQQAVAYTLIAQGVTEVNLYANQEPYWKFMVGMNSSSYGFWNEDDAVYASQFPLGEQRNHMEKMRLMERLHDVKAMPALFVSKWAVMWAGNDESILWSLEGTDRTYLPLKVLAMERAQYMAMAVMGFATLYALLFKRASNAVRPQESPEKGPVLFLLALLLAYAALHLVIEVQVRYRLDIMPFFTAIAGFGCLTLGRGVLKRRKAEQKNDRATGF